MSSAHGVRRRVRPVLAVALAFSAGPASAQFVPPTCVPIASTRAMDTLRVALPAWPVLGQPGMPETVGEILDVLARTVNTCLGTRHEFYVAHLTPPAGTDSVIRVLLRRLVRDRPRDRPDANFYEVDLALKPVRVVALRAFR
jgi:hypothetical protein